MFKRNWSKLLFIISFPFISICVLAVCPLDNTSPKVPDNFPPLELQYIPLSSSFTRIWLGKPAFPLIIIRLPNKFDDTIEIELIFAISELLRH